MEDVKVLSVKEAAERLGVSERTVQRWVKAGVLKVAEWRKSKGRGGKTPYFSEEEIERFLHKGNNDNNDMNNDIKDTNYDTKNDNNDTNNDTGKDTKLVETCINSMVHRNEWENQKDSGVARTEALLRDSVAVVSQSVQNAVEHSNDEVFEDGEWWISLERTATLLGSRISVSGLKKRIQKALELYREFKEIEKELKLPDGMRVRKFPARNRQGYRWMVAVASLPMEARIKWAERKIGIKERSLNGEVVSVPDKKKLLALKIYEEAPCREKDKAIRELAEKLGVSRATIYRWLKEMKSGGGSGNAKGVKAFHKISLGAEKYELYIPKSSVPEELFVQAVAWMAEAPRRRSIKDGWEYLAKLCKEFGYEAISYAQWTRLLKKMRPSWKLIKEWAVRGETAFYLENLPPIRRSWLALNPYTVLCGDQHFCDYEAVDELTGEIVKITLYMWIDCTSRYWAGVWPAFGAYTRYTVGLSFAEAVKIALPEYCYNDWGKQERSKYFKEFRQRLSGWFPGTFADVEEFKKRFPDQVIKQKRSTPGLPPVKPIEAAFRKFESMMLKRGIPGLARGVTLPDHWERKQIQEELKRAKRKGEIPTVRELFQEILSVVREHNEGVVKAEGVKICPARVLAEGLKKNPRPRLPEETIEVLCYPWEEKKVSGSSVSVSYRGKSYRYIHPLLLEFKGQTVHVAYEPPLFPEDIPEKVYVLRINEKRMPEVICTAELFAGNWVHPLDTKELRKAKEHKMEILHEFKAALSEMRKRAGVLEAKEIDKGRIIYMRPAAEKLRRDIRREKEAEEKRMTNEEALEILARSMGVAL